MSVPGPSSLSPATTPRAPSASSVPPPPDPASMQPFTWSCRCSNITLDGKVSESSRKRVDKRSGSGAGGDLLKVWVEGNGERVRQSRYAVYDTGASSSRGRERTIQAEDGTWRRCTLCDVRVYKPPPGHNGGEAGAGVKDAWVEVDLDNGILYGSRLSGAEKQTPALPFSGLRLPLESKTSQFGRPPQTNFPQLYPPAVPQQQQQSGSRRRLIPTVHDPFFLPPPFIPSHPHLRDLCADAVAYLQQTHDRYEAEVLEFVSKKAGEMRELEDTVRCEVEMLWNAYADNDPELRRAQAGEGGSSLSRRGSRVASTSTSKANARSASREPPVRTFSPSPSARTRAAPSGLAQTQGQGQAQGQQRSASMTTNPILNEAVNNPAYPAGSSLLSASLASSSMQQQQAAEPAPPAGSIVDDSIARVSQTYNKSGDARAVAMSHVFSVLDDAMANNKRERRRSRSRSTGNGSGVPAHIQGSSEQQQQNDMPHGKDSWIDNERLVAKGVGKEPTIQEESAATSGKQTPQPAQSSTNATKEIKRTVTFEEQPAGETSRSHTNGDRGGDADGESDAGGQDGDDHRDDDRVFDLEMDSEDQGDAAAATTAMEPRAAPAQSPGGPERQADPFEQEISARYAAHAPSHRSAWKRPENGETQYSWYRKGEANTDRFSTNRGEMDDNDQAKISGLATSMPVHIALPATLRKPSTATSELERKTSLSEREGRLVPPLMAAMKHRSVSGTDRRVSSQSVMDPGVLHDLDSDKNGQDAEEEDDDEDEDQQGTLRQSGFIPPHVIARSKQSKGVDGVRSIYDE